MGTFSKLALMALCFLLAACASPGILSSDTYDKQIAPAEGIANQPLVTIFPNQQYMTQLVSFASPDVSEDDIAAARESTDQSITKTVRKKREAGQLIAEVKARLRPAIAQLCIHVSITECAFDVVFKNNTAEANAYVDTQGRIVITAGLLQYMESADELAFVLAHEMSHHMANHLEENIKNAQALAAFGALLFGGLYEASTSSSKSGQDNKKNAERVGAALGAASAQTYRQEQELEADYIGLYAVGLASYDLSAAAIFMDKLSAFNQNSDQEAGFFDSHPSSPEREARLIKIEEEILTKRRTGADLLPNRL